MDGHSYTGSKLHDMSDHTSETRRTPDTQRPTLKTIARLTGLSVPTVSRALSDAEDINADTKAKVRMAAKTVGYRPNRAGVRLRTGKTNVISLVMATDHDMMNHTARLITSIAATLRDTPYHMIITPYDAGRDPMEPVRYIVETASADGLILNQTTPQDPRVAYLMDRGFPFATHGRTSWSPSHPYFDFDNAAFARIVLDGLAARGRRSVLLVLPPPAQSYSRDMMQGARDATRDHGLDCTVLQGATSDDPSEQIEAAVVAALRAHPEIDAVLCGSTNACMAAATAVEALHRVVGADIDLAAKEAIPFLKRFRAGIFTVHEDVGRAGAFVAQATLARIADPEAPFMQHLDVPRALD